MKGVLHLFAAAALLFVFSTGADAQPRPRYQGRGDDRYHRFGRGTLDRVRADLAVAERNLHYVTPPDMFRFRNARLALAEFQRDWERGRYDRRALDRAIENLHLLVDRGRLNPRDRAFLAADLRHLRELHGRLEGYRR